MIHYFYDGYNTSPFLEKGWAKNYCYKILDNSNNFGIDWLNNLKLR